ncbi:MULTISPECIES: MalY/PatB family protein [unclassified Agarivorans]|uniref:MalY/PatB family protein n=1 Tax=unclassified Agarivorans TaxID=2636026 RepID=UPI0026E1DEA1|nr:MULTISPECIES: PatB family C-S lyase [unclassified Agarivorans]MDO6687289.1 PatB family C-S lyase [Agarivorans sp. 3_MG-2023]MDO6716947.1 PatB family C-S lyase [Agarivorans sp. 2_MG-2023]
MSVFNDSSNYGENSFIKNKAEMLNNFYGTSDVFPYWVADMDFQVAKPISQELQRIVERGVYSYEFNESAVFRALSAWYQKRHNLPLNEANFTQVPGVLSGIALLLRQFTQEGDGVLIHTPAYHQFANLIDKANRKVVKSELVSDGSRYQIDFEDYERQIEQHNVKAVIFCNPHNPTGRVWNKAELAQLVEISQRHNVLLISDEIHSDIIYSGQGFTSLTSFDYANVIALIGSPAKTFGMHSIANGYIYSNNSTLLANVKQQVAALYLDHGNAFSAFATVAAFEKGETWLDEMLVYLEQSVSWISDFIEQYIPQIKMYQPEGTYQIWFDFSGLGLPEEQLKTLVFKKAKMGLTPGSWFGAEGVNFMRMNIATSRENIMESFGLLKNALEGVKPNQCNLKAAGEEKPRQSCC